MATTPRARKTKSAAEKNEDLFGLDGSAESKKAGARTGRSEAAELDARFKTLRGEIEEKFDRLRATMKEGFSGVTDAVKPSAQKERFSDIEERLKALKSDIREGFSDAEKSAKSFVQKSQLQDIEDRLKQVRQDIQSGFDAQTKALKASGGSQGLQGLEDSLSQLRRELREGFDVQARSLKAGGQPVTIEVEERVKTVRAIPAGVSDGAEASIRELASQGRRNFAISIASSLLLTALIVVGLVMIPRMSSQKIDEAVQGVVPLVQRHLSGKIDSLVAPMKKSIDQSLEGYGKQMLNDRAYMQVMEAGNDAQNGSRAAFGKLSALAAAGDDAGKRASARIAAIRKSYDLLRAPDKSGVQFGEIALRTENGERVALASLSTQDLCWLLSQPGLSLNGIHQVMGQLWTRPSLETKQEFARILKSSDNLAACVAASSVVAHQYGMSGDLFNFKKWEAVVRKK